MPKWASWGYRATSCRGTIWIITSSPYKKDIEATVRLVTCLQPTGSKKTGHTKADNISKKTYTEDSDTSPCLCCSDLCIKQQKMRKLDVLRPAWSVAGGHTVHVPGMSEFMCEIAPTIK